jgi:hypothetical protein
MSLSRELIEAEHLACECAAQRPVRRLVSYGKATLSLLFCETCGLVIVEERDPDELAVMRQDIAALKMLAGDLYEQLADALREDVAPRQAGRVPLRVLPGGREPPPLG